MQQEYIRGVSAWNFNLEDLRNQAALVYHLLTDHLVMVKFTTRVTKTPFC